MQSTVENDAPEIKYAIVGASLDEPVKPVPGLFDTYEEAQTALDELENAEMYTIAETRDQHEVDPNVIAAEEKQINETGKRDVDEASDGEEA